MSQKNLPELQTQSWEPHVGVLRLRREREAIKALGSLGFFLVCVKEDRQLTMGIREPKKDPKEGSLWEGQDFKNEGTKS